MPESENTLYLWGSKVSSFIKAGNHTGKTKTGKRVVSLNLSDYASFSDLITYNSCRHPAACKIQERPARKILFLYTLVLYRSRIHTFHWLYRGWHLQDDPSWSSLSAQLPAWDDDERWPARYARWSLLPGRYDGQRNVYGETRMHAKRQYDEVLPETHGMWFHQNAAAKKISGFL